MLNVDLLGAVTRRSPETKLSNYSNLYIERYLTQIPYV